MPEHIVRGKVAFDQECHGYRFLCTYLEEPKGDALVEIARGPDLIRSFFWPAYKIWNIPAHVEDIVDGLNRGSDEGLRLAGTTE
jgi:hypothetical protein